MATLAVRSDEVSSQARSTYHAVEHDGRAVCARCVGWQAGCHKPEHLPRVVEVNARTRSAQREIVPTEQECLLVSVGCATDKPQQRGEIDGGNLRLGQMHVPTESRGK